MQVVRTILWVLVLVLLLAFSFFNWQPVEVTIWPNLILETKIPALVIIAFLLGLVPTWLLHRGVKWRLKRRIASLENAARVNTVATTTPASTAAASPEPSEPASAPTPTAPTGSTETPAPDAPDTPDAGPLASQDPAKP